MASRRLARLASPRRFIPGKRSRFASGAEVPFVLGQAARASSAAAAAAAVPFNANLLPLGTNRTADCRCRARSSTSSARQPGRSQRVSPPVPRRSSPSPDSQVGGGGIGGGSLCGGGSDGDNDEYRWMHDADSDETLRHLEHENRYSAASLRPLRRRARELHRCMVSRQPEEEGGNRRSVPEQLGGYLYYTRRDEGKGFPVYVRRPVDGALGDEQTVLDMNEVEEHGLRGDHRAIGCSMHGEGSGDGERDCGEDKVEGYPSPSLGLMKLSPDQRMLACTVDLEGNDRFVLAVFDLEAGDGAQGDAVEAGAGAGMGKAAVLREDAMWDDVVGVEWGSSWPAAPGTDRGTTDGVTTDGGATDEGTGGDRCYGLYYTVPDDLRRPWQVRHVTIRTTRLTSVAAASCDDRENKRAIRDRARGRGGGGDGRKYGKRVSGGDGSGGRSVEEGWEVDSASDRIVFEEKDDAFFADVGKTKDGAFVVINVHSKTTSEVYFLPATNPTLPEMPPAHGHSDVRGVMAAATGRHGSRGGGGDHASGGEGGDWGTGVAGGGRRGVTGPTLLRHRRQGIEYYVDHSGDAFYLVTNSSASKNDDGGVGVQTAANAEAIAAGEYRLVRVIQPRGGDSLEGVADAPWEAVPYGRDASSSCSAGDAANGGKAAPNTHGEEGMLPEEVDRICRGLPLHRADGAEFELAAAAAAAACIKGGGGGSNGLGVLRGDYVGSKASAAQGRRGTIQEMDLFKDRCVLYESCPVTGSPQLRVVPLTGSDSSSSPSSSSSLPLPSASIVVSPPAPGGCHGGNVHGGSGGSGGRGSGSNNGSGSGTGTGTGSGTSISTGTGTGTGTNTGSGSGTRGGGGAAAVSGASTLRPGVNSWFDSRTARFSLSSPTAPEDVYDLCLESGGLELLRRTEVPGSPRFDGRDYSCYTIQVASHDGDKVPLTIAHRRGLDMNGGNRLLLHGYGSYGMTMPIDYQPGHACMLERGWVLAFAHVRGGGERGKAWHAAGRGLRKWNSFWDFEACAEHLISAGLTSSVSMGVYVNSAGGLLGGVMANTRPGLFSAMVMKAPFLGVLSAMRDTSLPLTVHEFDEWGDPSSSQEVESMIRSYCPYENVREQEYPALLVTASTNDNRVNVWDPAKWVSRVRAVNTGKAPVLLRVSDTDGHHGPGNTLDSLRDAATEMAFLEQHLVPSEAVR